MKEITKDMKAEEIYRVIAGKIKDMNQDEIDAVCRSILEAPGSRAMVIYWAKRIGWWNQNDEDTCQSILEAPGNRAWVIYLAKRDGWWFQNDEATCKSILEAPGDRALVISLAKDKGLWIEPKDQSAD